MRALQAGCVALALCLTSAGSVSALRPQAAPGRAQLPTEIGQVRFNAGQAVVPYFEGWIRNPDGTFDLVFGYFNRNWKEEVAIPAGPENRVEPGPVDAGQPTYFLPRRQRFAFRVRVPADFGKKEVAWTLTANGRTEKGYGSLLGAQEITERVVITNGNFNPGHEDPNQPPTLEIGSTLTTRVGTPLSLTALVSDDGLPKPRVPPPTTKPSAPPTFGAQVNSSGGTAPRGLSVSWVQYRGPARASISPAGPIQVSAGKAGVTVTFATPGVYELRVTANDGALSTRKHVTITVQAASQP